MVIVDSFLLRVCRWVVSWVERVGFIIVFLGWWGCFCLGVFLVCGWCGVGRC